MRLHASGLAYGPANLNLPEGLSFQLREGELLHLTGPNGAGKTLLALTLLGLKAPRAGRVDLECREAAYLPQTHRHLSHLPYSLAEALGSRRIPSLLGGTNLARAWNKASGGERQRVMLSRFFAAQGDFLVLDEPFNHVDAGTKEETRRLLREALARPGTGAILISHEDNPAAWLPGIKVITLHLGGNA